MSAKLHHELGLEIERREKIMTFDEWWEKEGKYSSIADECKAAWDFQQARIEALENALRCIGDYAAGASARHSREFTVSRFDEIEHRCKAALLQEPTK